MKCRRFLLALLGTAVMLCGCGSKSSIQVNFEGVVTQVNGSEITLEDTRVVVLSEKTACSGSREFAVGNFVQGHTGDDPDSDRVTADAIYLNIVPQGILARILINYEGTVLVVSHDRYFINRFATKVIVLESEGIKEYLGNYDDYFEKINRDQEPDGDGPQMTRTAMEKEKKKSKEEQARIKERKQAIANAEAAVAKAEEEAAALEAELADPATYADAEKAANLAKAYQAKKDEIDRLYAVWEALEMEG